MIVISSQSMNYFDCSAGASCGRFRSRPTAMDAFCQAYGSVDSGVDSHTQDDTSDSLGTLTPESIIRAAASTPDNKKPRDKRKTHLIMTEVEADAGKKAKCIFFTVGPK